MIETEMFDIVGHIDIIKKFGFYPEKGFKNLMQKTALKLSKTHMVVEVNMSGLDKPCKEQYPGLEFLEILKNKKVRITLGGDSHAPNQVARYFTTVVPKLKKLGFKNVTAFNRRKAYEVELG